MKAETEKLYTQAELLEMGWTKTLISKFLPDPILKPNPMYHSAPPMKLYKPEAVEAAMQTADFLAAKEKADKRRASAQKAVETKTAKLEADVMENMGGISVTVWSDNNLRKAVIVEKNEYFSEHGMWDAMAEEASDETMTRWIVNFIRHNLVEYDERLYLMDGKTGKDEVYRKYKTAILQKIAEAYPQYADECKRQTERIF